VGDRFSAGGQFTQDFYPLSTVENLLRLLGGVVLQQKRCDALQLGRDLAVGAGQQFADTRFRGARQTVRAANEEIDLSAAVADPVAAVARARPADRAAAIIDTDQRPNLVAPGAARRIAPQLPIAGPTNRPNRQGGLSRDGALAHRASSWATSPSAARRTYRLPRRAPSRAGPDPAAFAARRRRRHPAAIADPGAGAPVSHSSPYCAAPALDALVFPAAVITLGAGVCVSVGVERLLTALRSEPGPRLGLVRREVFCCHCWR
jgi:hypothetical protein